MTKAFTIDEYIANQPEAVRPILETIRSDIHTAVPGSTEATSYTIPTFRLHGKNMIHFAAYEKHVGLYATPDGHVEFEHELSKYKRGKGSVQFPLDAPIPYDLIIRIARFRALQLEEGGR